MSKMRRKGLRIGLEYEVIVSKGGKVLSKCRGRGDPFVRNWIRMLRTQFYAVSDGANVTVTLLDVTGTSRPYYGAAVVAQSWCALAARAPSGTDTYGILVGTSDLAWDRTHYNLQAKIAHGTGTGQLLYGDTTVEDYAETDTQAHFRVTRAFTNNSGATITVKEIGIAIFQQIGGGATVTYKYLVARDVLPSPQSIPDGASLTVRYRLYIAYT